MSISLAHNEIPELFEEFPDELKSTFQALGDHPSATVSVHALAAMTRTTVDRARQQVNALVTRSLLEDLGGAFYQVPEFIQQDSARRAGVAGSRLDRIPAVRRCLEFYVHAVQTAGHTVMPGRPHRAFTFTDPVTNVQLPEGLGRYDSALAWLEQARRVVLAAMDAAVEQGWPDVAFHLGEASGPLDDLRPDKDERAGFDERALLAARRWGDPAAITSSLQRLARHRAQQGRLSESKELAEELIGLALGTGCLEDEASASEALGYWHRACGDVLPAVLAFRHAAQLRLDADPWREALTLIPLSETLCAASMPRQAQAHLHRARELLFWLEPADEFHIARATLGLGIAARHLGEYEMVGTLLAQAWAVFIHKKAAHHEALALRELAELARQTGNEEQGRLHDEAATAAAPDMRPGWW